MHKNMLKSLFFFHFWIRVVDNSLYLMCRRQASVRLTGKHG